MSLAVQCKQTRKRGGIFCIILLFIILGLYSRSMLPCPAMIRIYGGDVLWAGMFYFIFTFLFPNASILKLFLLTLLFSFLIEFSQLIETPWLQEARQTMLRYLLGQGFLISDLFCYVIGCLLATSVDYLVYKTPLSYINKKML